MTNCEACKTAEKRLVTKGPSPKWCIFWILVCGTLLSAAVHGGYLAFFDGKPLWGPGVVCIIGGIGVIGLLLNILGFFLLGQCSWHYKDADGDRHQHLDRPEDGQLEVLVRLRHGGILRRSQVFKRGEYGGIWRVQNWNGSLDCVLVDSYGRKLTSNGMLQALSIIATQDHVSALVVLASGVKKLEAENGELKRKVTGLFHDIDSLLLFVEGVADTLSKKPRWSNADRAIADVYNALLARGTNPERGSWLKKYLKGRALPLVLPEPKKCNLTEVPVEVEPASQAVPPS